MAPSVSRCRRAAIPLVRYRRAMPAVAVGWSRLRRFFSGLLRLGILTAELFDQFFQKLDHAPALSALAGAPLARVRALVGDLELQPRHRRAVVVGVQLADI